MVHLYYLMAGDPDGELYLEQQQKSSRKAINLTESIQSNPSCEELKRALAVKLALQGTPRQPLGMHVLYHKADNPHQKPRQDRAVTLKDRSSDESTKERGWKLGSVENGRTRQI